MPLKGNLSDASVDIAERHQHHAGDRRREDLQNGQTRRRRRKTAPASPTVAQNDHHGVSEHRRRHQNPSGARAQRSVGEVVDRLVGDRNRAAGPKELDHHALETEEPGQRDDEGGEPKPGDQRALKRADRGCRRQSGRDRGPPRPSDVRLHQHRGDGCADAGDESQRKIDLAEDQNEHFTHADQHEHRALHKQVHEIAGREKVGVLDLEDDRDQRRAEHDRQHPALPGQDLRPQASRVATERLNVAGAKRARTGRPAAGSAR